ncbi:hypothetical protein [Methylocystis sp.]|uniref:hypothetical protein n=1 Tax=Methylocystis sp. TaxID=1911079 RepID=UPI0025DD0C10|nr:hypothetical protein [Methylocystis sp.]
MNDLIIPPEPRQPNRNDSPAKLPVEIVIDRRRRRPLRYGLIAALIGLAGLAATRFYPPDRPKEAVAQKVEARAPQQVAIPALDEATKSRIAALQGEVQELRTKLDAVEKRQQAEHLSAKAASAPPPTVENKAAASAAAPEKPDSKLARAAKNESVKNDSAKNESAKIDMTPVQTIAPAAKVVSGYRVRDVYQGAALIESDSGMIGVEPGEIVPGVGRVIAIRERAGRWVVVTESGEILGSAQGQPRAPAPRQRQFARELNGFMPHPFAPPPMFPPY